MVFIPGGTLHYRGRPFDSESDEAVSRDYAVKPFCIDKEEVRSAVFWGFMKAIAPPVGCSESAHAATCSTREEAETYCSQKLGGARLPSPEEFAFAAGVGPERRFPWGDTFFPWGDDSVQDRPPKSRFCAWEVNEGQLTKERRVFYPTKGCTLGFPTDDVSPLGVNNLGSNVLEWTSGTYTEEGNGIVRCTVMGLDFTRLLPNGFPAETDLVSRVSARCDPNLPREQRASDLVGFRCATSVTADKVPAAPASASP